MKNKKLNYKGDLKMKNLKNQKGITLVALVVTIIVLLILAGVSLSLVAGSDGILGRATNAVDKNQIAMIKEKIELKVAEEVENFYEAKYVDRTIDNATTALEYISGSDSNTVPDGKDKIDRRYFSEAGAEYEIVFETSASESKFYVNYLKGNTKLSGKSTGMTDNKVKASFSKGTTSEITFNYSQDLAGKVSTNGSLTWYTAPTTTTTPSGS